MSTITAGTTSGTALQQAGDTTGTLVFKTNDSGSGGTTALTLGTDQSATFAGGIVPSGSTAPTNGMYLPAANTLGFSTNSTQVAKIDSSGVLSFNSGYGSVAAAYACRAWVNFNGTGTVAIRASANVSSITDNGTGDYTINMTTAMPDINYNVIGNASNGTNWTFGPSPFISSPSLAEVAPTTSAVRLVVGNNSGSFLDAKYVCYAIFR
jgi:hypothetical protein